MNLTTGSIVCLNGARIDTFNETGWAREELAFGLYRLLDHEVQDRAAFVHESGWWIEPLTPTNATFFIGDWDLWAETDPRGYANHLRDEREAEFHAGDDELTEHRAQMAGRPYDGIPEV